MQSLGEARIALEDWLRSVDANVAADVVPPQGDVGNFSCTYHSNINGGKLSLTLATVTIRIYVSRAEEKSSHLAADNAQTVLYQSLESWCGPWSGLIVNTSSVSEETIGEATYTTVRLDVTVYV